MNHWTDVVPYIFMAIKVVALGVAGYYAIKWHFDKDKEVKAEEAAKAKAEEEAKLKAEREANTKES